MAVTQFLVQQFLTKHFALVAGRVNSVDIWTMFYPENGGGVDAFMNVNMVAIAMPYLR